MDNGFRMNARILIVEDEEPLTMLLRYNLEAEGYEVETSARGDEADTRLKESTPGSFRDRTVPPAAGAPRDPPIADHHAHRAR
jgi:DNA-binding NtrC family response regulator